MDRDDRADDEQEDGTLAAVAAIRLALAAVQPDARGEDRDAPRRSSMVRAVVTEPSHLAPMASVATVAIRSIARTPSTTMPVPLATFLSVSARFTDMPGTRHSRWSTRAGFP